MSAATVRLVPLIPLLLAGALAGAGEIAGIVRDPFGAVIAQAGVTLASGEGSSLTAATTDNTGGFRFAGIQRGRWLVGVTYPGFDPARRIVRLATDDDHQTIDIVLAIAGLSGQVTVTADPGHATDANATPHRINVVSEDEIATRAGTVVAEAIEGEVGVQLQRTAPAVAGVFVRGLGGNNVSIYVDGVRYSTATERGGIKTFLSLIEPTSLSGVEVLRGPQGAQYGSASVGGSLQLLSHAPAFAASGTEHRGRTRIAGSSADRGFSLTQDYQYAGETAALLVNLTGRRVNPLRPGNGLDDHAAVTRYLGLPSSVIGGDTLPDTGFTGYGGHTRFDWAPTAGHHLSLQYRRGQQDGVKRYDDLLGGNGHGLSDIRGLMLDLGSLRYETSRIGWLDSLSLTASYNSQREEQVRQTGAGDPTRPIRSETERTTALGLQLRGARSFGPTEDVTFGAEFYDERVDAFAHSRRPNGSGGSIDRPRIPDGASYRTVGTFAHGTYGLIPDRLVVSGGVRATFIDYRARATDSPVVDGAPLWPDSDLAVSDFTYRAGAVFELTPALQLSAGLSRGFRAPSVTDLGTLGLTGSGFEVANDTLAGLGAEVGDGAGRDAVSLGVAAAELAPETSLSIEGQVQVTHGRARFGLGAFRNAIEGAVEKRAAILPPGAVGLSLGGEPIVAQSDTGAIFVGLSSTPVLLRANVGAVLVWGIEQSLELEVSPSLRLRQAFTYLRAEDRETGEPPSISGGFPAPDGSLSLRYEPHGRAWWTAGSIYGVLRQERLSSLALQDRRIGAFRSRDDIAAFFKGGATVRGLVDDGILLATGETLAQVQDRVLGVGVDGAPLHPTLAGYVTVDLQAGWRPRATDELVVDVTNILDQSHRGMAWGMPGAGRGLRLRYAHQF